MKLIAHSHFYWWIIHRLLNITGKINSWHLYQICSVSWGFQRMLALEFPSPTQCFWPPLLSAGSNVIVHQSWTGNEPATTANNQRWTVMNLCPLLRQEDSLLCDTTLWNTSLGIRAKPGLSTFKRRNLKKCQYIYMLWYHWQLWNFAVYIYIDLHLSRCRD